MPWGADLHHAEASQPFLPTCGALLVTLTTIPRLLGSSLPHDLLAPPAPPSGPAGQFSHVATLTGL